MPDIEQCFTNVEAAAAAGERCPENGRMCVRTDVLNMLALQGRIRIHHWGRLFRQVEILSGPHAGKKTAAPTASNRVWKIVDSSGVRTIDNPRPLHPRSSPSLPVFNFRSIPA